jgi:branched-chain amino acid transport system permease protein
MVIFLTLCLGLLVLPFYLNSYYLHFSIMLFFWAYLGQCWNILGGLCGQLSLGHAAFFAVGSYTSSLLFVELGLSPWLGMLLGGILGTGTALFIGYLSFRYGLKGPYFALVTIAFAELLRVLVLNVEFTKGPMGILIPLKKAGILTFQFEDKIPFYYIILCLMLLITGIARAIQCNKIGYYFVSIRENEDAAESVGVDTMRYKLLALGVSAFFTSLGGSFYAQYVSYIDPGDTFGWHISVEMILRNLVGGLGTIPGPLLGSLILSTLSEITRAFLGDLVAGIHMVIYATLLILVVLFFPKGTYVWIRDRFTGLKSRRE